MPCFGKPGFHQTKLVVCSVCGSTSEVEPRALSRLGKCSASGLLLVPKLLLANRNRTQRREPLED